MSDDLRVALELADLADGITLPRWRAPDLRVRTKVDMTPVSDADTAVETAVRRRLAEVRPGDDVLGEEEGGRRAAGGRRWIVDPIDGTRNFVRGVPVFATLLALEVDGRIDVGVVSAPALRRRWWASRGGGAHSDTGPLRVSAVGALEDAYISTTDPRHLDLPGLRHAYAALARRCWTSRALGDFWSHMLVAEGAIDVAVEAGANLWDWASAQLIVEEAGGRFTDLDGAARADGEAAVSTNGLLHDAVLEALRV